MSTTKMWMNDHRMITMKQDGHGWTVQLHRHPSLPSSLHDYQKPSFHMDVINAMYRVEYLMSLVPGTWNNISH